MTEPLEQMPHIHKARNERTLRDATSSFTHFPEELIVKTRRRPVKERLSMDIEFNEEAGEDKSDEEQAEQDGEEVVVEEDDLDEEDDYAFQNFDDDEDIVDDNDYDGKCIRMKLKTYSHIFSSYSRTHIINLFVYC